MSIYICMKVVIQHVCRIAILGLASLKPVFVEVQIELVMIIAINDSFSYLFFACTSIDSLLTLWVTAY